MKNPGLPANLWSSLDSRLWHATDLPGLKGVIGDGFIDVSNAERYQNAFCRCKGSVSLFDFGPAASDQSEFEFANWVGWFGSEQNAPYSIWLEIDRQRSTDRLMNPAAVRDACRAAPDKTTLGKLFIGVEACHRGPIALAMIIGGLVIDRYDPGFFNRLDSRTEDWPDAVVAFADRLPIRPPTLGDLLDEAVQRVSRAKDSG
jgi:hypothetical protein